MLFVNSLIKKDYSITSMEAAEMVETSHKTLMRKLDGNKSRKGIIEILAEHHLVPSEFFIESEYKDMSGKINRCYIITKKGCEFLAHKMTGAKGTVFTARYINRFHEMEDHIKQKSPLPELECNYQTTTPCPLANPFYAKFNPIIELVCSAAGITKKEFYFRLMRHLSKEFDLREARCIYTKERGHDPVYDADIIGYFPELTKAGEKFIWDFIFG